MTQALTGTDAIERALSRAKAAGAADADAMLVESDSLAARVRGDEIDYVKQARERLKQLHAAHHPRG